jgi:hypothetical protein
METTELILSFIQEIGITVQFETIEEPTFLPGILIRKGGLVVDENKLLYPGDLLHEAGHLAVMPDRVRKNMSGDLDMDPIHHGGELAAIAWSYAACIHLHLDPHIVFHDKGYKGGADSIINSFSTGMGIGTPLLIWQEMTNEKGKNDDHCFPAMKSWLCCVDKYELK